MGIFTMRTGATAHPEDTVMQPFTDLIRAGGVKDLNTTDNHLKVVQRAAGANMSVDIGTGRGFIKGTSTNAYPVRNTTAINVAVTSNSSGNPRKDAVVLYIDLAASPDSTASNVVKSAVVAGTPAASPSAPIDATIQTAVGASNPFLRLADITVANGETTIDTVDITDMRIGFSLSSAAIAKRVTSITSSSTPTPNADTTDLYKVTALAATATFGAPTGTPQDGQTMILRIKDNATARALNWNAIYRVIGVVLPTTTVVSKWIIIGLIYDATDTKWDVVGVLQEA
jgi:hypothetical protein